MNPDPDPQPPTKTEPIERGAAKTTVSGYFIAVPVAVNANHALVKTLVKKNFGKLVSVVDLPDYGEAVIAAFSKGFQSKAFVDSCPGSFEIEFRPTKAEPTNNS